MVLVPTTKPLEIENLLIVVKVRMAAILPTETPLIRMSVMLLSTEISPTIEAVEKLGRVKVVL